MFNVLLTKYCVAKSISVRKQPLITTSLVQCNYIAKTNQFPYYPDTYQRYQFDRYMPYCNARAIWGKSIMIIHINLIFSPQFRISERSRIASE